MKLTRERTFDEVRHLTDLLKIQSHEKILDLGCGWGRHTLAFAELGYKAVGIDASKTMIERAMSLAKESALCAEFLLGDYHSLDLDKTFDVAMFLFGSFGFDSRDGEDLELLRKVRAWLKEGGRLLIDQWNPEALKSKSGAVSADDDLLEKYTYDSASKRLLVERTYPDEENARRISIRVYTFDELKSMLQNAGFRDIRQTSDDEGMVILARK